MNPFEKALIDFTGDPAMQAACDHALAEFPRESCGFITGKKYVACDNQAKDPLADFVIDDPRYERAMKAGKVKAIIHSHPNGPIFPSGRDMQQQIATDVAWIILTVNETGVTHRVAWGGKLPTAPVIGRPFVHGIFDCYSIIRDTFALGQETLAEQGIGWPMPPIALDDYARNDNWWEAGDDLYSQNFEKQGFRVITRADVRPGDAFLMKLGDRARNPQGRLNHAGLLIGHELVLHHLPGRLSRREPAGMWARAADLWLRYEGPGR